MTRADRLALYARAAALAFGDAWQAPAAAHHGVAVRTVQRWVALQQDVPDGVLREIHDLLDDRVVAIDDVLAEIEAALPRRTPNIGR